MSIFRKKETEKKYVFEDMEELSKISSAMVECCSIVPYADSKYLKFRIEKIDAVQARWNRFAAIHPEFEDTLKMNVDILEMTKKCIMTRLEMMTKEGQV
jgi:hypothetical protein